MFKQVLTKAVLQEYPFLVRPIHFKMARLIGSIGQHLKKMRALVWKIIYPAGLEEIWARWEIMVSFRSARRSCSKIENSFNMGSKLIFQRPAAAADPLKYCTFTK